ncbi:hypothetical protein WDW89_24460 [Deltaproteobacteria bacterium TL4]
MRILQFTVSLLFIVGLLSFPSFLWSEPTEIEFKAIRSQVDTAFRDFIQLWREERYFELYEKGKLQSQRDLKPGEYATRMVELNWVPVKLIEDPPIEISFQFRTLIYVTATIEFGHKSNESLRFKKRQTFLLLWEKNEWRFDLLQMIRAPFYTPENVLSEAKQETPKP